MESKTNSEPDSAAESVFGRVEVRPLTEVAPVFYRLQSFSTKDKPFRFPKTRAHEFLEECAKALTTAVTPGHPKTQYAKKHKSFKPLQRIEPPKTAGKESAQFINTMCHNTGEIKVSKAEGFAFALKHSQSSKMLVPKPYPATTKAKPKTAAAGLGTFNKTQPVAYYDLRSNNRLQRMGDYLFSKNFVTKQNVVTKIINSTLNRVKKTREQASKEDHVKHLRTIRTANPLLGNESKRNQRKTSMIEWYAETKNVHKPNFKENVFMKTGTLNEMKYFNTTVIPECQFGKTINVKEVVNALQKQRSKPRFKP